MPHRLYVLFSDLPAFFLLSVHLEDIVETGTVNAESAYSVEVLADDEAGAVDAARHTSHVRHHYFVVLAGAQI